MSIKCLGLPGNLNVRQNIYKKAEQTIRLIRAVFSNDKMSGNSDSIKERTQMISNEIKVHRSVPEVPIYILGTWLMLHKS